MGSYKLWLDDEVIGMAYISQSADGLDIYCTCPFEARFIYRVEISVKQSINYLIGVMVPDGGKFILKKTIRNLPLERALKNNHAITISVDKRLPNEGIAYPLPFVFSKLRAVEHTELPSDKLLSKCISKAGGIIFYRHSGTSYYVFSTEKVTEFNPFLCVTNVFSYQNKSYAVIAIDSTGDFVIF